MSFPSSLRRLGDECMPVVCSVALRLLAVLLAALLVLSVSVEFIDGGDGAAPVGRWLRALSTRVTNDALFERVSVALGEMRGEVSERDAVPSSSMYRRCG